MERKVSRRGPNLDHLPLDKSMISAPTNFSHVVRYDPFRDRFGELEVGVSRGGGGGGGVKDCSPVEVLHVGEVEGRGEEEGEGEEVGQGEEYEASPLSPTSLSPLSPNTERRISRRISKEMISLPMNFRHVLHIDPSSADPATLSQLLKSGTELEYDLECEEEEEDQEDPAWPPPEPLIDYPTSSKGLPIGDLPKTAKPNRPSSRVRKSMISLPTNFQHVNHISAGERLHAPESPPPQVPPEPTLKEERVTAGWEHNDTTSSASQTAYTTPSTEGASNTTYTASSITYTASNTTYTTSNVPFTVFNACSASSSSFTVPYYDTTASYSASNTEYTVSNTQYTATDTEYNASNTQYTSSDPQYTAAIPYSASNPQYTTTLDIHPPPSPPYANITPTHHSNIPPPLIMPPSQASHTPAPLSAPPHLDRRGKSHVTDTQDQEQDHVRFRGGDTDFDFDIVQFRVPPPPDSCGNDFMKSSPQSRPRTYHQLMEEEGRGEEEEEGEEEEGEEKEEKKKNWRRNEVGLTWRDRCQEEARRPPPDTPPPDAPPPPPTAPPAASRRRSIGKPMNFQHVRHLDAETADLILEECVEERVGRNGEKRRGRERGSERATRERKRTPSLPPALPHSPPPQDPSPSGKLRKPVIGHPTNFQHVAHIGFDGVHGEL